MRQRPAKRIQPGLEHLEMKELLSVGSPGTAPPHGAQSLRAQLQARLAAAHAYRARISAGAHSGAQPGQADNGSAPAVATVPFLPSSRVQGVTMDRITNPNPINARLTPPFQQVLVQSAQPVPGHMYNVLYVSVYNATKQTFTANDGLAVKITNQAPGVAFPVLTGSQEWKPRQRLVFYVLTNKYYPLAPTESAGFEFNFLNPHVVAIPGPSGIALNIRYNPATFNKVLDHIVVAGAGAKGHLLGLPDTSIWELIPNSSNKILH